MTVNSGQTPREGTCYGDPKSPTRIVDKNAGREKVAREGRCRCQPCIASPDELTRFHLVGRDLGGDDLDDNLIPVCRYHHDYWEHGASGKVTFGPRIWASLHPWEKDYVLEKKGVDFVRRYYKVDLLD